MATEDGSWHTVRRSRKGHRNARGDFVKYESPLESFSVENPYEVLGGEHDIVRTDNLRTHEVDHPEETLAAKPGETVKEEKEEAENQPISETLEDANYQSKLGISVRVKDIFVIVASSIVCGLLAFRSKGNMDLLWRVVPFQAFMVTGIFSSYLRRHKHRLRIGLGGTMLAAGATVALSLFLNSKVEKLRLLYRPIGWLIENVGVRILSARYISIPVGPIAAPSPMDQAQRVERWIRSGVALAITAITGTLCSSGVNLFRILTNKKWL